MEQAGALNASRLERLPKRTTIPECDMRNTVLCALAAALLFAWPQDGLAEIYSYRDENGVMVFSDTPPDASQVAPANVEVTKESLPETGSSPKPAPPRPEAKAKPEAAPQISADADQKKGPSQDELQAYFEGLKKLHEQARELGDEKQALQEEVKSLEEKAKRIRKRSAMRVHNSKVQEINDKIKELAERAREHDRRLQAYEQQHAELREAVSQMNATP